MSRSTFLRIAATLLGAAVVSGCLTRRTVTQNGRTVEKNYVIKRPIRDAVQRGR